MHELNDVLVAAHRANINRYRRLLQTHLTSLERDFIERRLAEERRALEKLYAGDRAGRSADRRIPPRPALNDAGSAGLGTA